MKCVNVYDARSWNKLEKISVMRRKNNSSTSSMNFPQKIHNHNHIFLIEITRWLVCQESHRFMNEGSGNTNSLRFSSWEMFWVFIFFMKHTYFLEKFSGTASNRIFSITTYLKRIRNILCNSLWWNQFIVLKYHTASTSIRAEFRRFQSIDVSTTMIDKRSCKGFEKTGHSFQKCRFSTPTGTAEKHPFALFYLEIKSPQNWSMFISDKCVKKTHNYWQVKLARIGRYLSYASVRVSFSRPRVMR